MKAQRMKLKSKFQRKIIFVNENHLPVTILLNNPTAAIVTVLARCQKFEGCLSLGKIQSMLYPISCEMIMYAQNNYFITQSDDSEFFY